MYAIIDTGNNQEKVEIGSKIEVDFISDKKKGDTVKFDKVLLLSDGKTPKIGKPYVAKAFVSGKVLDHAKKNNIFAGIHNATPEYAKKMLDLGFNLVTVGSDQRYMSSGAKEAVSKLKLTKSSEESKSY